MKKRHKKKYFQVYRNHAPRMVFSGYSELALELWTHHEASQRHEKKKGYFDFTNFFTKLIKMCNFIYLF